MSTGWEPLKIAGKIDAKVRKLRARGYDDTALFEAMIGDIPEVQRLLRMTGRSIINELFGRFPGLHRYGMIFQFMVKEIHASKSKATGDGQSVGGRRTARK